MEWREAVVHFGEEAGLSGESNSMPGSDNIILREGKLVCGVFVILLISFSDIHAQDRYRNKGIYNITQYSFLNHYAVTHFINLSKTPENFYNSKAHEIHTEFGFFVIKKHLSLGLGLGYVQNLAPNYQSLPIDFVLRFFANKVDNSFVFTLRTNGSIYIKNSLRISTGVRAGTGYKFFLSKKCFIAEIFWQSQAISMDHNNVSISLDKYEIQSLGFSIGIMPF